MDWYLFYIFIFSTQCDSNVIINSLLALFIFIYWRFPDIMFDAIKSIPVHMDFVGQGRAEKLYQIIIVLFGVVGLVWGYTIQQFSQTVYILGRIIQDVNP